MTEAIIAADSEDARPVLWPHLLGLALVLLPIAAWIGTGSAFITDESFVRIQVDALEDDGSWLLDHPFPEADPSGEAFPIHGTEQFDDGYVAYGKHPTLIYLYVVARRLAGDFGMLVLSVVGTVAAAGTAGWLARRWRPSAAPLTVWMVGLASPLFFDSFVVHAHTLGAATATIAVAAALRYRARGGVFVALGLLLACLATTLLRTEGLFFIGALALMTAVSGLRPLRPRLVAVAALMVASAVGAVMADRLWSASLGGSTLGAVELPAAPELGFLSARVSAFAFTWLLPGYRGLTTVEAITAIAAILVILGCWLVARRADDPGALVIPLLGGGLLLVRSVFEWGAVPGLLLAFCVGWAGLAVVDRTLWSKSEIRIVLATCAVYAGAVLVTQYPAGGHTEWGGRYFALMVPALAAVSATALHHAWAEWSPPRRHAVQVALGAATLGLCILSVSTLHSAHERNERRVDTVLTAASELGPASDGGSPVVVTEDEQIPRLAEARNDDVRFLLVGRRTLPQYLERLADLGIEDLLLVSEDAEASLGQVAPWYEPVGPIEVHGLQYRDTGSLIHLRLVDG